MLVHFYNFIERLKSSPARRSKLIIIPCLVGLIINLLIWGLIYFKFRPLVYNLPEDQAFVPLHYNIYLGIDSYGAWQTIFLLPFFGVLFLLINTLLAFIVFNKREILSYFLSFSAAVLQIFFFIASLLTILINI